jgi:hypothetical protein
MTAVLAAAEGQTQPVNAHPVFNNIGKLCRWQQACMARQQMSMRRALTFVSQNRPPAWRIQLCNRNASRTRSAVDWFGFDNCIRNSRLRRPR